MVDPCTSPVVLMSMAVGSSLNSNSPPIRLLLFHHTIYPTHSTTNTNNTITTTTPAFIPPASSLVFSANSRSTRAVSNSRTAVAVQGVYVALTAVQSPVSGVYSSTQLPSPHSARSSLMHS